MRTDNANNTPPDAGQGQFPFATTSTATDTALLQVIAFALERLGHGKPGQPIVAQSAAPETRLPNLDQIEAGIADLRMEIAEIKELLTAERGEVIKEAYTVEEVAKKTSLAPYTIRQACNTKRIKGAYKGRDRAWRIPHAELLAIQNNGLPRE